MTDPILPEFELIQDFIQGVKEYDYTLISPGNRLLASLTKIRSKNERASLETPFSHYKSMGNILDAQVHLTP